MNDIRIPDSLPHWIKEHVALYLRDGEAGHYWDASLGGGKGMLTTLLLTTTGRKSGKPSILPLIYRPTGHRGLLCNRLQGWRSGTSVLVPESGSQSQDSCSGRNRGV